MPTIAYSQVQELVMRLPVKKLPLAYKLLASLVEEKAVGSRTAGMADGKLQR